MQNYEVWKGNIAELLKTAAREKKLSTLLVSLAPLASPRLWLEMCKAYSDQLAEAGHIQKAASYLIACHRLEEAITLLVDKDRFADALILAKCRGSDPTVISTILRKWAQRLAISGKLELAAERLVAVGDLDSACQLYCRSKLIASHRFAALVAKKAGNVDKAVSIAKDALEEYLVVKKWDIADSIISEHPQLQALSVLVETQRLIVSKTTETMSSTVFWGWLSGTALQFSLLDKLETYAAQIKVTKEQLSATLASRHAPSSPRDAGGQMWLEVSVGMCLAWTTPGDVEQMLKHLLKVLDIVYQIQLHCTSKPHLLLLLCSWLAPDGPLADDSIFIGASHPPACAPLVQSLRAYLCAAITFWLEDCLQQQGNNASVKEEGKTANVNVQNGEHVAYMPSSEDEQGNAVQTADIETNKEVPLSDSGCNWTEAFCVLKELADDLVNAEAVAYFKGELRIKKLVASLASAVASGATPQGKDGNSGVITVGTELKNANLLTNQVDTNYDSMQATTVGEGTSEVSELLEQILSKVGVAGVHDSVGNGAEGHNKTVSIKETDLVVGQSETAVAFTELVELKRSKETFEDCRVSVPNPYFIWFKLQNVCDTLLLEHKSQGADTLRSHLAYLRKTYLER